MDENRFLAFVASNFTWATFVAFIGVTVRHYMGWKAKKHKFFSAELTFGAVIAIFMGFIGGGIAEHLNLGENATTGVIAALGYVGPHFLDRLAEVLFKRLNKE